jgi:hypothetical protein
MWLGNIVSWLDHINDGNEAAPGQIAKALTGRDMKREQ